MAEWFKAHAWKACKHESVSRVRIPSSLQLPASMKIKKFILLSIAISCCIVLFSNCKKGYQNRFGPFYILNDTTIVMNGDMGSRIDNQFDRLIAKY